MPQHYKGYTLNNHYFKGEKGNTSPERWEKGEIKGLVWPLGLGTRSLDMRTRIFLFP